MKNLLLPMLVIALGLTACRGSDGTAAGEAQDPAAGRDMEGGQLPGFKLVEGVIVPFETVTNTAHWKGREDARRREVLLEFAGIDDAAANAELSRAFEQVGWSRRKEDARGDSTYTEYQKEGYPIIKVWVRPNVPAGFNSVLPESTGTIYMAYTLGEVR